MEPSVCNVRSFFSYFCMLSEIVGIRTKRISTTANRGGSVAITIQSVVLVRNEEEALEMVDFLRKDYVSL